MTVIQHVAPEGPALLGEVAAAAGVAVDIIRVDRGEAIPRAVPGALVVLGGPMAVYEAAQHPWLADEQALLRAAVVAGAPVLGICLGSQQLAAAFGADVRPSGGQEIGFHEVTIDPHADDDALFGGLPRAFAPVHWHGDVFELPRGAVALASSARTAVQAYRLGARAWGVLFHPEADAAWVAGCARAFADELREHGVDPDALAAAAPAGCAAAADIAREILARFVRLSS
jgi:GMP synthase-like glutamine amidotransferase